MARDRAPTLTAVIAARGGSLRIPRKNATKFCGKPLVQWPIEAAIASKLFERVILSSDDNEIQKIGRRAGAEILNRPADLSGPNVPVSAVVRHAIEAAKIKTDWVVLIYGTAALLTAERLQNTARHLLLDDGPPFVVSVLQYGHPIQRALLVDGGIGKLLDPKQAGTRTQDAEPRFHDAGQFVFGRREAWRGAPLPILSGTFRAAVLSRSEVVDIDSPADWLVAEAICRDRTARSK